MLAYNVLRQARRRFSRGYFGVVIALDDNSSKCKVLAPGVLEDAANLPWASVQNSFATETHGQVFTPRIASRVFVTFPTGDANHPVIVPGWNASPSQFDSPGTQHGWQDEKGNYLKVDETACTFTLHLSTGAEITVDENNKMTIKATDVCIEADGDIDMTAGGDLSFQATNVSTNATNVSTEATNVTTEATLVDTQSVTISSAASGPNTITGLPISLN